MGGPWVWHSLTHVAWRTPLTQEGYVEGSVQTPSLYPCDMLAAAIAVWLFLRACAGAYDEPAASSSPVPLGKAGA